MLERVRKRAQETGRYVPEKDIEDSLERVPRTVERLCVKADFTANIENSGDTPRYVREISSPSPYPLSPPHRKKKPALALVPQSFTDLSCFACFQIDFGRKGISLQ